MQRLISRNLVTLLICKSWSQLSLVRYSISCQEGLKEEEYSNNHLLDIKTQLGHAVYRLMNENNFVVARTPHQQSAAKNSAKLFTVSKMR
jgi:hypothetical protein